ncbi:ATP-binding protein [uncultured Ruminococcus sp.]|uniref:ATP-binding protein n=1 Tax=uncultured Ruminococcus sp. TaxID=165186 RepID=UPI00293053AA|nr:ATP-binding protein [uncultured Ruminococcus sp.]
MKRLLLDATDDNLSVAMSYLGELLDIDCSPRARMHLEVAFEEIFVNIAHYAYGNKTGQVEILFDRTDDDLKITFIDSGKPYDPLAKPDPDTTLSAELRQIGGLGIFLVKKYMDDVAYEYRDGKNIFSMIKKLH